jgi:hypothetical protein
MFLALLAFAAPQVIPQTAPQTPAPAAQPAGFGQIEGTVVRQGTTDPIPDVQITLTGRGGMTAQDAQSLPAGAYQSTEFLAKFEGRGTAILIEAGARSTTTLKSIPDDSSKR